ncbi:hypothetical protein CEQ90_15910 [Lewinellaceae bacterium SD302]|nr:hypothetical protein CEQ90_15910 [Lewinellaceae bacterium SD302]
MVKPNPYLRWSNICLLAGFGWLVYRRGMPWRNLVWDEGAFQPLLELIGVDWGWWVSSPAVEVGLLRLDWLVIIICWLGGLALLLVQRTPKQIRNFFLATTGSILLLNLLLNTKGNFWRVGYFIEHAAQVATPFLLLYLATLTRRSSLTWWLKIVIALTFIGHGLFALGVHPVPPHFVLMTTEGLSFMGISKVAMGEVTAAKLFLFTVGIMDLLAALLLLLPGKKWMKAALCWIIPWAILTTLARLWSGGQFSSGISFWSYWVPEFLVRVPHVLLPVLLWKLVAKK